MNAPEVWWSPSLAEDLSQGGLIERTGPDLWHQENGLWHRLAELPADAVRLVPEVVVCPARDSAGAPCRRTDPHGPDEHQAHPTIAERARAMGIKPSVDASEQIAALTGQPLSPPDTGQAREQILQRDITFGEYIIAVCDAIGLPHNSPRAVVVEAIRAAVAAATAPESPTDSIPKAGRGGSSDTETATDTGQTPDVAALAYARSEVDKWLASTDPYCILPTRTEHIPALLARLDELEGTS